MMNMNASDDDNDDIQNVKRNIVVLPEEEGGGVELGLGSLILTQYSSPCPKAVI